MHVLMRVCVCASAHSISPQNTFTCIASHLVSFKLKKLLFVFRLHEEASVCFHSVSGHTCAFRSPPFAGLYTPAAPSFAHMRVAVEAGQGEMHGLRE